MVSLNAISEALQKGKADDVKKMVTQALDEKVPAKKILEEGLIAGMDIIGGRFKRNEIYIPEVLIDAERDIVAAQALALILHGAWSCADRSPLPAHARQG